PSAAWDRQLAWTPEGRRRACELRWGGLSDDRCPVEVRRGEEWGGINDPEVPATGTGGMTTGGLPDAAGGGPRHTLGPNASGRAHARADRAISRGRDSNDRQEEEAARAPSREPLTGVPPARSRCRDQGEIHDRPEPDRSGRI